MGGRTLTRAVFAIALTVGLAACAAGGGRSATTDPFAGGGTGARGGEGGELRVTVRSSNFNEAAIFAVSPGNRRRLGRVQGNATGNFRLPWRNTNELHFEVDVLGGQQCVTRRVTASPGMRIRLIIDANPRPRRDGTMRICGIEGVS